MVSSIDAQATSKEVSNASTTTTSLPHASTNTTDRAAKRAEKWSKMDQWSKVQSGYNAADVKEAAVESEPSTRAASRSGSVSSEAPFADEVGEPWMSPEELTALRRGVEWYFSDSFLSTDQGLHHKISQNLPEGWLCISELMKMESLRRLGATPELLLKSLRKSHLETKVTLTADELRMAVGKPQEFGKSRGLFVRRRQPLPPLLSRERLQLKGEAAGTDPAQFVLVDRHQTMNRLRDAWRVQRSLKLNEVGDETTVFREIILPGVTPDNRPPNNKPVVFAVGYERVVYGDHGPYIEFASHHIRWRAWPHFFDKSKYNSYFNEYYTKASHSIWEAKWRMWDPNATKGVLMLYAQSRSVADRAWAPGAGTVGAHGNPHAGRPTGYADYRPGFFYLTADAAFITIEAQE